MKRRWHPQAIPWPFSLLYNAISSSQIFQHHYDLVADEILTYRSQGSLLDVGTGPGWLLMKIHDKAPQMKLVGIDYSAAMVDVAKKNTSALANGVEIRQGDAANLQFAEKSFDIVVSTASLHHWKEPITGINEIYRVLKNGGVSLIYDVVKDIPESIYAEARRQFGKFKITLFWLHSFEEPFYTQEKFKALAEPTLFKDCKSRFTGLLYCIILKKPNPV